MKPLVVIASMLVSAAVFSATPGIAVRGQNDGGCATDQESGPSAIVPGKWLAMSSRSIQPTILQKVKGVLRTENQDNEYFFNNLSLTTGEIDFATVKVKSTSRYFLEEWFISWRGRHFIFRKLGFDFELTEHSKTGRIISRKGRFPSQANLRNAVEEYDSEYGEWLSVKRAGDFNGDGRLDLLLSYREKEAHGLALQLSDKRSGSFVEVANSPTEFTDCPLTRR